MSFVHLHLHTTYSICDSIVQLNPLFKRVKELGQNAVAMTDHGNLYGAVAFFKKARANGIKPIIGSEFYVSRGLMTDRTADKGRRGYSHIVLLAKNEAGYKNIVKLSSAAFSRGFYYKPRIDKNLLKEHSEGIICLTACIGGAIQKLLIEDRIPEAKKEAEWYHSVFGDNFYLEIQNHGIPNEGRVRQFFSQLSKEMGVQIVATNDVHYLNADDALSHEVMLCIGTAKSLDDPTRLKYEGSSYHLTSEDEMRKLFPDFPGAIDITQEIANKVDFEMDLKSHFFPKYEIPQEHTLNSYLEFVTEEGANIRFKGNISQEVKDRISFEIGIIKQTGFAEYFLVVYDFVKWARKQGIAVGPGRGCLVEDSKILLEDGTTKNFKEIVVGENVLTRDGNFERVFEKLEYDCKEDLINIFSYYGESAGVTLTADHEILSEKCVINSNYGKYDKKTKKKDWKKIFDPIGNLEWEKAENVNVGDWVFIPKPIVVEREDYSVDLVDYIDDDRIRFDEDFIYEYYRNSLTKGEKLLRKIKRKFVVDNDWAYILGVFAGDGWVRRRYKNETGFVFHEKDIVEKEFIKNFFKNYGCKIDVRRYKKTRQVLVGSKIFFRFFKSFFYKYEYKAQTKHIPDMIINAKEELACSFMRGLLFADGNYGKYKNVLSTSSRDLADQSRFLGLRCGILSSLGHDNRKDDREAFKNTTNSYRVNFSLGSKFGGKNWSKRYCWRDIDGGYLTRIRKIEKIKGVKKVFDIRVENNRNYCTSSFLVHNSGAGSMVVYCLFITDVNPIEYGLFFERFLNPERISMPDIDIDFCFFRRQDVINYVVKKYGKENVSNIITFGLLGAKSVINAVAKTLGVSFQDSQRLSKMVMLPTESLATNIASNDELKSALEESDVNRRLLKISQNLEGCVKYAGIHASGIVVASGGIDSYVPLTVDKEGQLATQYDMESVDAAGMLKVDFLGLRTMTVINETLRLVKIRKGIDININEIPMDDPNAYKALAAGETSGVFQLESHGMRKLLGKMGMEDNNFRDLIALVALYRPGPLNSGMTDKFVDRKKGLEQVTYLHESMRSILDETYGVIVYQEQIMQIAVTLCGFTLGRGDVLRKAMGKKKADVMDAMREEFVQGGIKTSGMPEDQMTHLFDEIEKFAAYGFNKSHSTCYALIAYWTVWLKVNYTVEFMASLLTSVADKEDKIKEYFLEAKRLELPVLLPDINESFKGFEVTNNDEIRYSLSAIRNLGGVAVERIIEERAKGGRFATLEGFCSRVKVSKKQLESLVKCGAFDSLARRSQLMNISAQAVNIGKKVLDDKNNNEMSLLDMDEEYDIMEEVKIDLPDISDWTAEEKGRAEKEILGLSVSYNTLDIAKHLMSKSQVRIDRLEDFVGRAIQIPVIINEKKERPYSKGVMAHLDLMDITGSVSAVVFDKSRQKCGDLLKEDSIAIISGRVDHGSDKIQIIVDDARAPTEEELGDESCFLTVDVTGIFRQQIESLQTIFMQNPGSVPVKFLLNGKDIFSDTRVNLTDNLISSISSVGVKVAGVPGK